jgi:hypothetical protein
LIDGTPQGMRTAEVGNWTGLALVCPRTALARFSARPEVRRTGVYILVGPSDSSSSKLAVYVGEGDDVWSRIVSHDATKDFWTWVVLFVSKDDNMTKAHVRWLEGTLVREITAAKKAEINNGNEPSGGKLPEVDTADMQTFFENMRLVLPVLGVNVFAVEEAHATASEGALVLELKWEDAKAECVVRDGQFIVRSGAYARVKEVDSLGDSTRALRHNLLKTGVLLPIVGSTTLLRFTQEYAFDSPSAAAGVVAGTGLNGRAQWKVKGKGISYKEWQEQQVDAASKADEAVQNAQ